MELPTLQKVIRLLFDPLKTFFMHPKLNTSKCVGQQVLTLVTAPDLGPHCLAGHVCKVMVLKVLKLFNLLTVYAEDHYPNFLVILSQKSGNENQGPVVQSIVSLTSSLRGQLVKCFTTL